MVQGLYFGGKPRAKLAEFPASEDFTYLHEPYTCAKPWEVLWVLDLLKYYKIYTGLPYILPAGNGFFQTSQAPHLAQRNLGEAQGELLQFRQRLLQLHLLHGREAQVQTFAVSGSLKSQVVAVQLPPTEVEHRRRKNLRKCYD